MTNKPHKLRLIMVTDYSSQESLEGLSEYSHYRTSTETWLIG